MGVKSFREAHSARKVAVSGTDHGRYGGASPSGPLNALLLRTSQKT